MSNLLSQASLVMIPSGYKEDVVYSAIPTNGNGDLSFTRASNGTRVNSAGLVEVCPWNLVQNSENFSAVWNLYQASLNANTTTAPNGTLTADSLIDNSGNDVHIAYQDRAGMVAGTYTISVYAKASTLSHINLQWYDNVSVFYTSNAFNLSNGTTTGANQSIESVGNGWYRCSFTFTTTVSGTQYIYVMLNNGTSNVYVGTGSGTVFIWGAQLNIGSTAKPYFPTTDRLNVPRLTYQNGGGGCPSLLLEKQSTNLALYSQDISNTSGAYWGDGSSGGTATLTANYATSPDGTSNATRVQLNQGALYAVWQQVISTTGGQSYTYSIWMKAVSGTPTIVWIYDGTANQNITLTNEWVRYTWTFTAGSIMIARFGVWDSVWGTSSSADILAWGAQLEVSSYPTSYIPTTSSSATRVADACSKTGISSLIGQTQGTIFLDINFNLSNQQDDTRFVLSDGSTNNWIFVGYPDGGVNDKVRLYVSTTATTVTFYSTNALLQGRNKIACGYQSGNFVIYLNGVLEATNSTAMTIPTCSNLTLEGSPYVNSTSEIVNLNQAVLFGTRLSNSELASLTSL